ncbi:MAG: hypothetical protein Q8N90_04240 [bacterium]|nr:hypothetical protein [bacterium]
MRKYTPYLIILSLVVFGLVFSGADFNVFKMSPRVDAAYEGQTISVSVTSTISFTVATSTIALATLTPGTTPVTATTSCETSTNNAGGWTLSAKRDDATSTMDLTTDETVNFPDATAWNGSNSSGTPGTNLSFRVYQTGTGSGLYSTTWWGTTDGSPLYAGFPSSNQSIATIATYVSSAQTVVYGLRADAPLTQKTGSYDGAITLTALANP